MIRKRVCIFVCILLFLPLLCFAETVVGTISYLTGWVDLQSNGEVIELYEDAIGTEIHNYDVIETGDDGIVEITLEGFKNHGSTITIQEHTTFSFTTSIENEQTRFTGTLIAGSMGLKLNKLIGTETVSVKSQSVVMGVRGTTFSIQEAPEGSVLVTCGEGQVLCTEGEREAYAEPGSVVTRNYDESLYATSIAVEDIDLYREFWFNQREEVFKRGALTFIKGYYRRYISLLPKFLEAFENMQRLAEDLQYYAEDKEATTGEIMIFKQEVSPAIIRLRSVLPSFQEVFYSLNTIERYHKEGYGRGMITDAVSSTFFFRQFNEVKTDLVYNMAMARYWFSLFSRLPSTGTDLFDQDPDLEMDSLMDDVFGGDSLMDTPSFP